MRRVNESLSSGKAEGGSATPSEGKGGSLGIGLLDVFGFEIFEVNSLEQLYLLWSFLLWSCLLRLYLLWLIILWQVNSLEQLCINHTNEKLQNFFLRSVFKVRLLYTY